MSDCVGATRMIVCRENYPFACFTIKSPDNAPIEFAIEKTVSIRIVFLNYQSQKHLRQQSCSRPHIVTALLDNVNVHRAAAKIIVSKSRAARGSVCNVLLCCRVFGLVECNVVGQFGKFQVAVCLWIIRQIAHSNMLNVRRS